MNVGLPVRSRVNSWHNVLISMQERTKSFLVEKDEEVGQLDTLNTFLPIVVPADSVVAKGNHFRNFKVPKSALCYVCLSRSC